MCIRRKRKNKKKGKQKTLFKLGSTRNRILPKYRTIQYVNEENIVVPAKPYEYEIYSPISRCSHCKRTILTDRLETHAEFCSMNRGKKRSVFDSRTQRLKDIPEEFLEAAMDMTPKKRKRYTAWKKQHEDLRKSIKEAKKSYKRDKGKQKPRIPKKGIYKRGKKASVTPSRNIKNKQLKQIQNKKPLTTVQQDGTFSKKIAKKDHLQANVNGDKKRPVFDSRLQRLKGMPEEFLAAAMDDSPKKRRKYTAWKKQHEELRRIFKYAKANYKKDMIRHRKLFSKGGVYNQRGKKSSPAISLYNKQRYKKRKPLTKKPNHRTLWKKTTRTLQFLGIRKEKPGFMKSLRKLLGLKSKRTRWRPKKKSASGFKGIIGNIKKIFSGKRRR